MRPAEMDAEFYVRGSRRSAAGEDALGTVGKMPVLRLATALRERLRARACQLPRYLLHDLDINPFQRSHSSRVIRQNPDSLQIQVGEYLRAQADLAMNLALAFRQRRQTPLAMKRQIRLVANFFGGETLRRLMQVN